LGALSPTDVGIKIPGRTFWCNPDLGNKRNGKNEMILEGKKRNKGKKGFVG
jgi:hypothetical protein